MYTATEDLMTVVGVFKSSDHLKHHVRTHTGAKPYSCRHCSERFTWAKKLKAHLLKSHNEGTWFTCHICGKKFTLSHNLEAHIHRHGGVKPYVCCECPKCFYTAGELKHHRSVHSDFKPFCCGSCGKYFRWKRYVPVHFKRCADRTGFFDLMSCQ